MPYDWSDFVWGNNFESATFSDTNYFGNLWLCITSFKQKEVIRNQVVQKKLAYF